MRSILNRVSEELERRILHGIACEWEEALLILKPYQRSMIRMPLFCIKDMESRLGYWSRQKREISLSRNLVLNHPWYAVKEVLLHEMAHQYTDEVLFAYNEPPHGPSFQRACCILRANPKASGKYMPIDVRLFLSPNEREDKIIRRIKKLLSLAGSQNKYEAESAMAKAYNLLAKYNLELLERDDHRDFLSVFLGKPALRHNRADYLLAHLLQDFYFVKGIWVSAYVLQKGRMGRVLEIIGSVQNIQTAAYVFDFIRNFINSKWSDYNRHKRLNHYRKIDFSTGIIEGFKTKLIAQDKEIKMQEHSKGIVNREDTELVNYFKYRYPRTRVFSRRGYCQDERVLNDGKQIGKMLVIHKGVSEMKRNQIHLIE